MSETGGAIRLRPAGPADARLLWALRNEDSVRRASFHPEEIPLADHERWFAKKMGDARFRAFVVVSPEGRDVGYVRFDFNGAEGEISVAIGKGERGKGYGLAAIRAGSERVVAEGLAARVLAFVRRDNPASIAAFERAGYRTAERKSIQGIEGLVMVYGVPPGTAPCGEVLIRVDAGPGVGLGHLQRCLSLAEALRRGGAECSFVLNERAGAAGRVEARGFPAPEAAASPSWSDGDLERTLALAARKGCAAAVVDGYGAGAGFLRGLREGGLFVAAVDDLCREPFPCQLAVNGGVHAKGLRPVSSSGDTSFLFGPEYALLRPELWELPPRAARPAVSSVLLTLGGTDDFNLMPALLQALDALPGAFSVTAIIGPYFANGEAIRRTAAGCRKKVRLTEDPAAVRELMGEADLAVSAGGQTLYELAASGTPAVAIQLAENQAGQMRGFAEAGFIRPGGTAGADDVAGRVGEQVGALLADSPARARMAAAGQALIDGRGAIRVAERILDEAFLETRRAASARQGSIR